MNAIVIILLVLAGVIIVPKLIQLLKGMRQGMKEFKNSQNAQADQPVAPPPPDEVIHGHPIVGGFCTRCRLHKSVLRDGLHECVPAESAAVHATAKPKAYPEWRTTTGDHTKQKTFQDLMDDYYAAPNPLRQYEILEVAARIAKNDSEKLQVVVKINQIKRDHGF